MNPKVGSGVINSMCLLTTLRCNQFQGNHPELYNLRVVKLGKLTGHKQDSVTQGAISKSLICSDPEH